METRRIRRKLIPYLHEARQRGVPARLEQDKIIINGKSFTLAEAGCGIKDGILNKTHKTKRRKSSETDNEAGETPSRTEEKPKQTRKKIEKSGPLENWLRKSGVDSGGTHTTL